MRSNDDGKPFKLLLDLDPYVLRPIGERANVALIAASGAIGVTCFSLTSSFLCHAETAQFLAEGASQNGELFFLIITNYVLFRWIYWQWGMLTHEDHRYPKAATLILAIFEVSRIIVLPAWFGLRTILGLWHFEELIADAAKVCTQ